MKTAQKTVLVVDDDPKILKAVSLRLTAAGYRTLAVWNGAEALFVAKAERPDLIIADVWMPVGMGLSMAHRLREFAPDVPVVFLTADKGEKLKNMSRAVGAAAFLEKPYSPEVLLATVAGVLKTSASTHPNH